MAFTLAPAAWFHDSLSDCAFPSSLSTTFAHKKIQKKNSTFLLNPQNTIFCPPQVGSQRQLTTNISPKLYQFPLHTIKLRWWLNRNSFVNLTPLETLKENICQMEKDKVCKKTPQQHHHSYLSSFQEVFKQWRTRKKEKLLDDSNLNLRTNSQLCPSLQLVILESLISVHRENRKHHVAFSNLLLFSLARYNLTSHGP